MPRSLPVALAALLLLAGCAGQDSRDAPRRSWTQHSELLQQLQHWSASGKLALRTEQRAESATIEWWQQGQNTELQLSGPMGLSATTIHSDGKQVEIRQGEELRTLDISTPDAIVRSTGWDLPLGALPYWLKGIPSPNSPVQFLELDPATDRARILRHNDWEIHYRNYEQFDGFTLPTDLRIRRATTSGRVIIRDWQVRPG